MAKILVIGGSGQLGMCLKTVAKKEQIYEISFPEKADANILDLEQLTALFYHEKPTFVINCAAYTAVDKAEDDQELAARINRDGVINLAKLCQFHHAVLIHVSTDFVFDGKTATPLTENDPTFPINVYGRTKLEGEQAIATQLKEFFILRTSWLYSEFGNNFVKTMLKLGQERDEVKVITDQIGTPTYAVDLARVIFKIIESNSVKYGLYHYSNQGLASWYDFAKAIFEISNTDVRVLAIHTSEYITRAVRPTFSVMDKSKIKKNFNIDISYWRESLVTCIRELKG
jgi:dTDP-4-dehydrorhamnose reductase